MANEQGKNPTTGAESDISKAQSQQQPTGEQRQQGGTEPSGDQAATGKTQTGAGPDEGLQGDTATQQRSDVEGGSLSGTGGQPSGLSDETGGQAGDGFVGSRGQKDSSSELIDEEDEDFASDKQGAPEGK